MNRNVRAFGIIGLCGIIGILFAILVQLLYEQNIMIPELIGGTALSLRAIQLVVILVWEINGIVVAAIES